MAQRVRIGGSQQPLIGDAYYDARGRRRVKSSSEIFACLCGGIVFALLLALAIGLVVNNRFPHEEQAVPPEPEVRCPGLLDLPAVIQPQSMACLGGELTGTCVGSELCGVTNGGNEGVLQEPSSDFDRIFAEFECAATECTAANVGQRGCTCRLQTCLRSVIADETENIIMQCVDAETAVPQDCGVFAFENGLVSQPLTQACEPLSAGTCLSDVNDDCQVEFGLDGASFLFANAVVCSSTDCDGLPAGGACSCEVDTCQRFITVGEDSFVLNIECVAPVFDPADDNEPSDDTFAELQTELQALEQLLDSVAPVSAAAAARQLASSVPVSWDVFEADREALAGSTVELRQADFARGTLRVRAPCKLVFVEDVAFDPNPDNNWQPTDAQRRSGDYPHQSGFALDFFAAMTIESDDVLIDLNGHELRQSRAHTLQQSFAQLISLGTGPFVPGEGPVDFSDREFDAGFFGPSNVVIRNGRLGANAHHAIHGNAGANIYIHDVEMESYRVAAIALNGAANVMIRDCTALGTDVEVPVRGTYSQARFLATHFLPLAAEEYEPARVALERLEALLDEALRDVLADNRIDAAAHPRAHFLFANEARQQDGNTFGLRFTNHGQGTIQFDAEFDPAARPARRVYVKDVEVRDTVNSVVEFVALLDDEGREVRGPAGDLFGFDRMLREQAIDELLDGQLAYAVAFERFGRDKWHVGPTHNVPRPILDWYEAGADLALFGQVVRDNGYRYMRNTDAMFHVNKGAHGLAVELVDGGKFENVVIDGVVANGEPGQAELMPGETAPVPDPATYTAESGGHVQQAPDIGYAGNRARGVILAPSRNVDLTGVSVAGVRSRTGGARDYDVFPNADALGDVLPDGVRIE